MEPRTLQFFRRLGWMVILGLSLASCASPNRSDGLEEASQETSDDGAFADFDEPAKPAAESDLGNLDLGDEKSPSPNAGKSTPIDDFSMPATDKEILGGNINENILLAPSDAEVARSAQEMASVDAARAKATGAESNSADAFDDLNEAGAAQPKAARKSFGGGGGGSRVPKIPGAALQKKGALLNRFYFSRQGNTAKSVSELLYGSADRAKDLTTWNGKNWSPGKLVYYMSPTLPDDREMRSFYQERNVPPEEYEIQKGETLKKIAKKKYGHAGSWKEIAVINGIANLRKVGGAGTRIALYPVDLTPYGMPNQSANGYRRNSVPPAVADAPPPEPAKETYPSKPQPPPSEPRQNDPVPEVTTKKKSGFSLDFGRIISQNLFAIVMGGAVFVLLLLLMLLAKQKRGKRKLPGLDEMNEEPFGEPPKKKSRRN